MATVEVVVWLGLGHAAEARRDAPWGDWIRVCDGRDGDATCDYEVMIGRTIQPDESDLWDFTGELTTIGGSGYGCYNSRTPMILDEGTDLRAVLPGIFRYEGSLLVRCYSTHTASVDARGNCESRPTAFVASTENRFHIEILRPAMDSETQLGGLPPSRQHPDTEKPPYAEIAKEWRVIAHCENGETTAPKDQPVWMVRQPRDRAIEFRDGELHAFLSGPMIFTMNPSWLDEIRYRDVPNRGRVYEVRPGLCRRAGDCLLWIVAPDWVEQHPRAGGKIRPTGFDATKENGYILRVLYPADQMK